MPARTRLAQFVLDKIAERGETPEEFGVRNNINPSGLYKFLRGAYSEPRQATLDKIAAGLNMSPVDLMVATGRGGADDNPDETELLAIYRQVPAAARPTVKSMLRGLAERRHKRGTGPAGKFGRDNDDHRLQERRIRNSDRRRAESRSVKALISQFGIQPAY